MSTPVAVNNTDEQDKPAVSQQVPRGTIEPVSHDDTSDQAQPQTGLVHLAVDIIQRNRHQPRQRFDAASISALAESISTQGLMQPIVVRPLPEDTSRFELIAGERRWRAAQQAGLSRVPALVSEVDDKQAAEWALIENLQREDLNPIEKAEAFQRLADQFALSHSEIAKRVGLERSSVSNLLRLLDLSDFVRDLVRENLLSMGQARAIAGVNDSAQQRALAEAAVREGWSVRQVESEARRLSQAGKISSTPASKSASVSAALSDLEKQIGQQLGTRVKIKSGKKKGAGTLSIDFFSLDEFDALMARLDVKTD